MYNNQWKYLLRSMITLLLFTSCSSSKIILNPVDNLELKPVADSLVYSEILSKYQKHIVFSGALSGAQCNPEIIDLEVFLDSLEYSNHQAFRCTCYNYELITKQKQKLYLGTKTTTYLLAQVCFDDKNQVVEKPNKNHILSAIKHLNKEYISLSKIDSISSKHIKEKTKFGAYPKLIYRVNEDKVFWEVIRYRGRLNVTIHEFKVDAISGKIVEVKKSPYRRTLWQWLSGIKY